MIEFVQPAFLPIQTFRREVRGIEKDEHILPRRVDDLLEIEIGDFHFPQRVRHRGEPLDG